MPPTPMMLMLLMELVLAFVGSSRPRSTRQEPSAGHRKALAMSGASGWDS